MDHLKTARTVESQEMNIEDATHLSTLFNSELIGTQPPVMDKARVSNTNTPGQAKISSRASSTRGGNTASSNDLEQLSIELYGMQKHSELLAERGLDAHTWFMQGVSEGTAFIRKESSIVSSTKAVLSTAKTPLDTRSEVSITQKRSVESSGRIASDLREGSREPKRTKISSSELPVARASTNVDPATVSSKISMTEPRFNTLGGHTQQPIGYSGSRFQTPIHFKAWLSSVMAPTGPSKVRTPHPTSSIRQSEATRMALEAGQGRSYGSRRARMHTIRVQLASIAELKQQYYSGLVLNPQQKVKLAGETELLKELRGFQFCFREAINPVTSPAIELEGKTRVRRVNTLMKKLDEIEDLKERQVRGEHLDNQQLIKIGTETAHRKDLLGLQGLGDLDVSLLTNSEIARINTLQEHLREIEILKGAEMGTGKYLKRHEYAKLEMEVTYKSELAELKSVAAGISFKDHRRHKPVEKK